MQQSKQKIDYNDMDVNLKNWMVHRSNELKIGEFDENKNMILTLLEVKHIQLSFYLFYVNRLHTEKEKNKYLNSSIEKKQSKHTNVESKL